MWKKILKFDPLFLWVGKKYQYASWMRVLLENESANKAVHSGFETQRRHHQKSKTGVLAAPKMDMSPAKRKWKIKFWGIACYFHSYLKMETTLNYEFPYHIIT